MPEHDYPGDVHWYDLPDDEVELGEAPRAPGRLSRLIPWRAA
ncbi:hypothetical protein ACFSTC_25245 [Nonomuraea ferruginea]